MSFVYVLPEKGMSLTRGYEAATIDLPFRINSAFTAHPGRVYQAKLGITTYTDPGSREMLLVPRSSSSLLFKASIVAEQAVMDNIQDEEDLVKIYRPASLKLENTVGVIDWDYRGEWMARFTVSSSVDIQPGKAYLQAVLSNPVYSFKVIESFDDIDLNIEHIDTSRAAGGYGSSDHEKNFHSAETVSES